MWVVPLAAAAAAVAFAAALAVQYAARRRPHQLVWGVALLMFAAASFAVFLGVRDGWSAGEFKAYWLLGAVLTVPYLAVGEILLLVRNRPVRAVTLVLLLFGTAFSLSRIRTAHVVPSALSGDLPSGADVFGDDRFALMLARLASFPAYAVLVGGALWSALRMRGRPEVRGRFIGTLAIAGGATIVAAGSAFAAAGNATGFSLTLAAGVAVMFWGFLRASRDPLRTSQ